MYEYVILFRTITLNNEVPPSRRCYVYASTFHEALELATKNRQRPNEVLQSINIHNNELMKMPCFSKIETPATKEDMTAYRNWEAAE